MGDATSSPRSRRGAAVGVHDPDDHGDEGRSRGPRDERTAARRIPARVSGAGGSRRAGPGARRRGGRRGSAGAHALLQAAEGRGCLTCRSRPASPAVPVAPGSASCSPIARPSRGTGSSPGRRVRRRSPAPAARRRASGKGAGAHTLMTRPGEAWTVDDRAAAVPLSGAGGALVAALAAGATYGEAGRQADVSERTVRRRTDDASFRQRVDRARAEMLARALGRLSVACTGAATTPALPLGKDNPPAVGLGAARAI